jgi:hypothetical protein
VVLVGTDISEVICSSETLVPTRTTWQHIPEDNIFHKLRMFKNGAEEHIWTKEGSSDWRVEKTA